MRDRFEKAVGRVARIHRFHWLWEPLETDPSFVLRPMFGGKAAYLDGKLMCYFTDKEEPWRGMLVATEHVHHGLLVAEFPELAPHPILPKWLYLSENADGFERVATRLVSLAKRRDPRMGVTPKPKTKRRKTKPAGRKRGEGKAGSKERGSGPS